MNDYAHKIVDFGEQLWDEAKATARTTVASLYRRTINYLRTRKRAYQIVFPEDSEAVKMVLADLSEFARIGETPWDADPRMHAVLIGRHEVVMRIFQHLNRTPIELNQLYGGPKLTGEYA